MASVTRETNGRRTIQFVGADKKRRSIRLGKVSQRTADAVKIRVESLNSAKIAGIPPDDDTTRWVASLDGAMLDKLAAVGLIATRDSSTLKAFLDAYVDGRFDVKGSTSTVYGHTRRNLVEYFGADKPLRDITPGDADNWRIWLAQSEGLADNTVRRRSGIAKQFFKAAVRRKLIAENPFADLVAAVRRNEKRYHFISRDDAQKVIDACPDAQWRLLFALSRYAGLRCPSEHLALRWEDVDFVSGRMTVHSPKTEHHEGGESRLVPIFPELLPYLEDARELEPDAEFVITIRRDATTNLRTRFRKIIKRAGLKPWPKLFQNLRSTRETELVESFPIHVACKWIGNSEAVARKHYLQMTDSHFEKAVQNPVQQPAETSRNAPHSAPHNAKNAANAAFSLVNVGGTGLEPVTSTV